MQAQLKVMNGKGHSPVVEDVDTIEGLERALSAVPPGATVFDSGSKEKVGYNDPQKPGGVEGWDPRENPDVIVVPPIAGG